MIFFTLFLFPPFPSPSSLPPPFRTASPKKDSPMKKFFVTLNLLAGMLFLTAAAEPNYSTPESTVRTHVYAIFEGNAEKAYQCFDKSTQDIFSFNNFLPFYHYSRIPVIQNEGMVFFRLNRAKRQGGMAIVKIMQAVPDRKKNRYGMDRNSEKSPCRPHSQRSRSHGRRAPLLF